MIDRVVVHPGRYLDSVTLMRASRDAAGEPGVASASAVMATPLNVGLLRTQGFAIGDGAEPAASDLLIAVRADDEAALARAIDRIERWLAAPSPGACEAPAAEPSRSLRGALRRRADLTLALVSVPGEHAAYECATALEAGLDVFCFSNGVAPEEETALKRRALDRGLLFMGPDCGTAILGGVALGFANVVRRGPVGIVGASGTGIQQVACLLDAAGVGISHAVGVGGRDLSAEVGGLMARRALVLLSSDGGTQAVVVIAKSPDPAIARAVAEAAHGTGKPTVLAFPGLRAGPSQPAFHESLEEAAAEAAAAVGAALPAFDQPPPGRARSGAVRGFFCGGTLCDEARAIVADGGVEAGRGVAHRRGPADRFVDFGADEYTRGRAHPMIDPSLRDAAIEEAFEDGEVAVVLADVVLGHGAHPDPASELADMIERARSRRPEPPAVIVSLCGTAGDPQGLDRQAALLRAAGATVTRSNAHAARMAVAAASGALDAGRR